MKCALCDSEPYLHLRKLRLEEPDRNTFVGFISSSTNTQIIIREKFEFSVCCGECNNKSPYFPLESDAWESWDFAQGVIKLAYSPEELTNLLISEFEN